jgi:uncharacterized membrane protein SpoIIM required for sporulation
VLGVFLDAFVAAHQGEWARLEQLVRRRRLRAADVDELVRLYQRAATHLSQVQSASPDPALVSRLSIVVTRARSVVTGSPTSGWQDLMRGVTVSFPAAVYRGARWWLVVAVAFCLISVALGFWVAGHPQIQASIAAPDDIVRLTAPGGQFETYYSSAPASSFAARVWANNALVAMTSLALGALLGIPVLVVIWQNAVNVGIAGGLMASVGRLDVFFGLILPHGLLELTAVFIAAGSGLRLGWTVIDPGPRRRGVALAMEGRSAGVIAMGLIVVLALSGGLEAFITPSGLPTWARIGTGALVEVAFLSYIIVFGRRAVRAGETGDVRRSDRADADPIAA